MQDNKIKISWKQFYADIANLYEQVKDLGVDKILCVTKGGLIPTFYLAKWLEINFIQTACISSYVDEAQQELEVIQAPKIFNGDYLIVDDLVDTGSTMLELKKRYPKTKIATLYRKEYSPFPDFYVKTYPDKWLVFPWDEI